MRYRFSHKTASYSYDKVPNIENKEEHIGISDIPTDLEEEDEGKDGNKEKIEKKFKKTCYFLHPDQPTLYAFKRCGHHRIYESCFSTLPPNG